MHPGGGIESGYLAINNGGDVVVCRQTVRRLADELRFTVVGQTMLVTAASELARNTLIHGGGGMVIWEVRRDGPKVGVRLSFEDRGPGISDLRLAMTAGWTSGRGMGLGLSGAKRLVHEFSIDTVVGVGTRITVTRWK
jgi:serine/threonine-protein kinase RsbT